MGIGASRTLFGSLAQETVPWKSATENKTVAAKIPGRAEVVGGSTTRLVQMHAFVEVEGS